jgi:hypothetical protein
MKILADQDCNAVVTTRDGKSTQIKASRLWDNGLAGFQGWHCSAGLNYVFVDHDLEVYGGQCRESPLGNLLDPGFALNRHPIRCTRKVCTPCESDLYAAKWRAGG